MAANQSNNQGSLFRLVFRSVFMLNAAIFFFQALTKNLFPPLLLPLRESFLIDNSQAGLLVTLVFFGYALARFPSGVIADHIGCTKTVLIGSAAMAFSFIGVSISPNYPALALLTFILGVSSGIYVTAGYTLAVIIGSRRRAATATAAFESFGIMAGIISPLLVTLFVLFLNWQLLFILTGLALIVVTLFFFRTRNRSIRFEKEYEAENGIDPGRRDQNLQPKAKQENSFKKIYRDLSSSAVLFRNPLIRRFIIWSTLVGGLGALSWTGINSFIPTFLVEERGYSYDVANSMFITVAVAGLAAKVGIGWLADRFGNNPVLFFNLIISIISFITLTLVDGSLQILIVLALLGAMCLNTNTLINSYVLRHMPPRYQGAGFGLFSTAYTAIYSIGPYFTGFLSDFTGLSRAIQLSSIGAVLAALLILAAGYFVPGRLVSEIAFVHR